MNIQITGRHFNISEQLQNHITNRVKSLDKFYNKITDVNVVVDKIDEGLRRVDITTNILNKTLRASSIEENMSKAIDSTIDKMKGQLKKENSKLKEKRSTETI